MTLIGQRARFTGPRELALDDGTRLTADQIVLATGGGDSQHQQPESRQSVSPGRPILGTCRLCGGSVADVVRSFLNV